MTALHYTLRSLHEVVKKETWPNNKNLFEVGPHRISGEYVIPEGGIVDGLCSKLLVLYTCQSDVHSNQG